MQTFIDKYKLPIIGGVIGLILAILLVTIGFFQTLLLVVLVILGAAVGMYVDRTKLLERYLNNKN
ncbi:Small integral membrane protein [Pediococcus damnosus]|uniref:Small integral membrane protein n=1 Tax=Pediococcus damnosus TaxID=51663 RepID=A0A143AER0_9LACO|nr:DUF2273 domain-containing protein [Pediococcus damnosus]AMV60210.1 Small integral membrane protein [Pediococcus damnosus]AMV62736.1 Small integral membrane protein [Pediococcus damnosus]AMV64460.1 Small integral membrane protein [Pediococcus damnosus]AMV67381.1 Small integral membrane protein [Pediococcus damnosus]AMV69680.1 Small integral membrane protein [Pediococcus damnosus]